MPEGGCVSFVRKIFCLPDSDAVADHSFFEPIFKG